MEYHAWHYKRRKWDWTHAGVAGFFPCILAPAFDYDIQILRQWGLSKIKLSIYGPKEVRCFSADALSAVISVSMLKGCYKASSGIPQVENAKFFLSGKYKYFLCVYCPLCKDYNMCWAVCMSPLLFLLPFQSVWSRRCTVVTPPVWSGCSPLKRWKLVCMQPCFFFLVPFLLAGERQISLQNVFAFFFLLVFCLLPHKHRLDTSMLDLLFYIVKTENPPNSTVPSTWHPPL